MLVGFDPGGDHWVGSGGLVHVHGWKMAETPMAEQTP